MGLGGAVLDLFAKLSLDSSEYELGLKDAEDKGASFSKVLSTIGKVGATAFVAVGTATVAMGKQAVDAYKNYEQLSGGIEKLFGEEGASIVAEYAEKAFLTSGKSINEYYNSVSQISASLKRSIGDDMNEVARVADVAMTVISDNVNTFGSDASFVESAIMGLSRQNYTMIDNLKLGYAGTAQGMLELINDSGILGKTLTDTSQLATVGFDQMILAIEEVQKQQGIAGTTTKEALTTIEGSANATKKAWENVITAIGRGEGISDAVSGLSDALFGVGLIEGKESGLINQLTERINVVMEGIFDFVVQSAPQLTQSLIKMAQSAFPAFFSTVTGIMSQFIRKAPAMMNSMIGFGVNMINKISEGMVKAIPTFLEKALPMLLSFSEGLRENIGTIVDAGIDLVVNLARGLVQALPVLIEYVPLIVQNIAGIINDNAPKLLMAALNIIVILGKGIIENIPVIIENAGEIVKAIIAVIQAINWIDLGSKLVKLIGDGIKALASAPVEAIKSIGKNVYENFRTGFKWSELGRNIIDGIVSGIKSVGSKIGESLLEVGKSAFDGVKSFFKIGSPSKLMRDEIGKWIPEGIAEGIKLNEGSVFDVMSDMPDVVSSGFNSGSYNLNSSYGGEDLSTVVSLLQQIADNGINVTLEGDAGQIFRVVRKQSAKFEMAKGYSAI